MYCAFTHLTCDLAGHRGQHAIKVVAPVRPKGRKAALVCRAAAAGAAVGQQLGLGGGAVRGEEVAAEQDLVCRGMQASAGM